MEKVGGKCPCLEPLVSSNFPATVSDRTSLNPSKPVMPCWSRLRRAKAFCHFPWIWRCRASVAMAEYFLRSADVREHAVAAANWRQIRAGGGAEWRTRRAVAVAGRSRSITCHAFSLYRHLRSRSRSTQPCPYNRNVPSLGTSLPRVYDMPTSAIDSFKRLTFVYKELNDISLQLDVYPPAVSARPNSTDTKKCPAVVYFHGGGLTVGNKESWFPHWLYSAYTCSLL